MSTFGASFLLVLDEGMPDLQVRAALPTGATAEVVRLTDALNGLPELVERTAPELALVGCSLHPEEALRVIGELSGKHGCTAIALCDSPPNGFLEDAFRAGAEDLLVLPQSTAQLSFSLEKALARRRGGSGRGDAPMIAVLGPKGGTGKTLTACNLAVALAHAGVRPVVLDLDLQFGDVGLALGLRPQHTIYDLASGGASVDGDKVDSFVLDHPSGARVLLAPTRPDQAAAIGIPFLRKVFEGLRTRHDFVIVDTPPSFSPEVIAAIDAASHLCVVAALDTLSLKDTKIGLETLEQMGYEPAETTLVLNRADSSVGIGMGDVERLLGKRPDVLVPSDRAVPRALTAGRVIVEAEPKSGAAVAFTALAERYLAAGGHVGDETEPSQPAHRFSLLRKAS